jgi:hypothetical protein
MRLIVLGVLITASNLGVLITGVKIMILGREVYNV